MTLNNCMSITPSSPGQAKGERFEHGSVLSGKTRGARVSSQWKSTQGRQKPQKRWRTARSDQEKGGVGGFHLAPVLCCPRSRRGGLLLVLWALASNLSSGAFLRILRAFEPDLSRVAHRRLGRGLCTRTSHREEQRRTGEAGVYGGRRRRGYCRHRGVQGGGRLARFSVTARRFVLLVQVDLVSHRSLLG